MRIGSVELSNNVFLAPMAGVTDMAYRILCKRQGCGLTYTEMVSAKGMHYKSENTEELLQLSEEELPAAVQIFGSDPGILAETAVEVEKRGAALIDINMGCPTPKIVKNGDGSALMQRPELIEKIVEQVSSSIKIPLTIKIRRGWDEASINAVEIAKIAEAAGAAAITVHGRTREQFYTGKADWSIIKKVKAAVKIPVIGNGDVFAPQDAAAMLDQTGCDAVMIGRGAEGNPWIFKRTVEYLKSGLLLPEPSPEERIDKIIEHLEMTVAFKGESTGVKEMRKHAAWYLKGLPGSAYIKTEIFKLINAQNVKALLIEYKKSLKAL